MSVMQRTITVRSGDGHTNSDLFAALSDDLLRAVAAWAKLPVDGEEFAKWPHINLRADPHRIWSRQWVSEHEPPHRLLTVKLSELREGIIWKTVIKLGAEEDHAVVLFDTRDVEPIGAQLPVATMPHLLHFLTDYTCQDEDGLVANRPIVLYKRRAQAFMRFLEQSPDIRQLPVVLISATNLDQTYLIDIHELVFKLQGLAHVIFLDASTRWFNDDLPLAHKCFDGAVRIYLPGYQPADAPAVHPWWHKDKFALESVDDTNNEIIRYVIEKTYPRFRIHRLFPQLQGEINAYRRSATLQSAVAELRQALTEEQESMFEEFYTEYEVLAQDRDEWKELAEQRYVEIRTLRFRINQQWETDDLVTDETVVESCLRLSRQALESFQQLDGHEQSRIYSTLLAKLAKDELREAQSEVRQALDGSCRIYPRSRSSNGQRVIYTLNDDIVYVCELYVKHDDYEYAWDQGITLADYEEFLALPAWE